MNRPREYLKLAKRCRELKDQARDVVSRSDLATLESSYLTLAESVRVLRRSNRVHKKLERPIGHNLRLVLAWLRLLLRLILLALCRALALAPAFKSAS